jgi:recombination protein RecA
MAGILSDVCKRLEGANLLEDEAQVHGYVDSGSYALNKIMSGKYNGGFPIGAITEIYGESSTAKTVFLTHAFVGAQKQGYYTIMVDNEHAYSPGFAKTLGVDPSKLVYLMPETMEACFEAIEEVIKAIREKDQDTPIVIGYDSIGVSPTKKEMEDDFGKNSEMSGAIRAKVAGQCLRRINPLLRKHKAALVIINQVRSKVGLVFGDPRTKAGGGKALLYYCAVSLETTSAKSDVIYDEIKNPIGIKGTVKCVKNKVTVPYQDCEFRLIYDKGLERSYGLTVSMYKNGIVTSPSKGWYSLEEGSKNRAADLNKVLAGKVQSGEIK